MFSAMTLWGKLVCFGSVFCLKEKYFNNLQFFPAFIWSTYFGKLHLWWQVIQKLSSPSLSFISFLSPLFSSNYLLRENSNLIVIYLFPSQNSIDFFGDLELWNFFFFTELIANFFFSVFYIPVVVNWPDELQQVLALNKVGMKHMLAMWWEWNRGINFFKRGKAILWTSRLCYKTTKIQMFWLMEWKIAVLHIPKEVLKL